MIVSQTVPKGWTLTGKDGTMDGKIFSLEITNVSIGTDPTTCNIVYPAGTLGIEQLHCQLIWKNDGWLVVSFGDTGTWLNDNLLKNRQATPINPGDTLSLANSGNNFI
ncbi:MAG: FHA domain-containing protein, partial [Selenomonadaceae bacterium]|nr:FHA domain-containing protein [Selenomonadaceae bacterium]